MRRPRPRYYVPDLPLGARPEMLLYEFYTGCVQQALQNRALLCPNYDSCLGYVCAAGWTNFTCRVCGRFAAGRDVDRCPQHDVPYTMQPPEPREPEESEEADDESEEAEGAGGPRFGEGLPVPPG